MEGVFTVSSHPEAPTPVPPTAGQQATAPAARPRAALFSGHYYASKRRANFHFLADALVRRGFDVTFVTVQISPISLLRGDPRFEYPVLAEANRLVEKAPHLTSYVWFTPFHLFHLRFDLADRLTAPLGRLYAILPMPGLTQVIASAALILVESTGALLLVDRIRRMNPTARLVYRVSDDVRNLGLHQAVIDAEDAVASRFDLISAPSRFSVRRFGNLPNVRLQPHGIDAGVFDRPYPSPYSGPRNAVSVGHSFYDPDLVARAAELFPDWTFHVIGRVPGSRADLPNVRHYGEIPFAETVPYIVHADIGLAPYRFRPGAETLADSSLKLMQYTWCRLPTVAPDFATRADRPHVIGYRAGDRESIRQAFAAAAAFDRSTIDRSAIKSWDEVARAIADPAWQDLVDETVIPFERKR